MIEQASSRHQRALSLLDEPVEAAGLAVFRMLFGALMLGAVIRFAALGWIDELYLDPSYHFTYLGFDWVKPWPAWGMYLHFFLMGLSALALALGYRSRWSATCFCLLFTYVELIDKSAYLNHYYLVSLLALLLTFLPSGAAWSLDALRRGQPRQVARWVYWLLRGQMTIVYFYAGFAKLNSDWLWRGEPLRLWLSSYTDVPGFGLLVEQAWFPLFMSWAGLLYDLSIAPLLLWRRTRAWAFLMAVGFHVTVWLLFPIGIFPWVMLIAASVFFDPAWPYRWLGPGGAGRRALRWLSRWAHEGTPSKLPDRTRPWQLGLAAAYLGIQALVPLRFTLYPGWVNWTEQGFRFSWRVMLIEKAGQVEFRVVSPERNETFRTFPRRELSKLQYRMMSTQPDMIHQYALELAQRFRARGYSDVRVFADAWVSFNGRPSQQLIDPHVDLAREPRSLVASRFILPLDAPGCR